MRKQLTPFWLLFILTGLNLLNYLDRFVLNAVRTPLASDFKIGYGDSGRTVTAFMIGYFLTAPFFGYLGDRFPRKWLIAFGIFVWSAGTMLTGVASGFAVLLFYRVLVGLGEASYATISPSLLSDAFAATRRNNALTIFYVAIPVGAALGYLVGGEISSHWSWRHAFIWAGIPGLLLALVLLPFAEPHRGQAELAGPQAVAKPQMRDYLNLLRNRDYQLVIWGYVAYTFVVGAFAFWGPTFLEKIHGLSTARADRFFGLVLVVAGLVGTLVGGFTATAWQKRNPAGYAWLLATTVLMAIPTSLAAFCCSGTFATMSLLAISMFLLFLSTGPVNTLIIESVPLNLRASAMALSIFMIHLFGDMWSPEIVGRLADSWGSLQKAVLILPAVLLVGGSFWLALAVKTARRTRARPAVDQVHA
jgi:MFS family permease